MDASVLVSEFGDVDTAALARASNWQIKYKLLMTWGNSVSVKPWLRQDEYLVRGCDTSLWLFCAVREERVYFSVDGDSRIIKGLAALLLAQVNGAAKADILSMDLAHLLTRLQLDRHLAPSRNNGFAALVSRVLESVRALNA
ncbi:SufE family protein [Simiduia curdlanivorans]|uniref:SufE family protein n=1 Tax=Simiduia curdlanivorans TaxID=1492769 RepID=A0ABV8V3P0_9GAMM|nr:SufE family protein [Simiduia curdlanivorans]MDN3638334.1 SufE family protein [Simiduia curdlanivorans]